MRRGYALLIVSLTGLGGAIALPGQDQPNAETAFKNITSFKGEKASTVIPAMEFMSASLKVECSFCHTNDYSSDAKEEKRSAREMIAMQREINKKNFGGRNQITCATCHAGHTHPINLAPVTGLEVRARRSQTVKPEEVLAAYGKAVGTAKALPGLHLKGTSLAKGVKSPLEAFYSGNKFAYTSKTAKEDEKQGFNGTVGWFTSPEGLKVIPIQYVAQSVNQKVLFTGPDSLPKITNTSGGTAKLDGKDSLVVMGTMEDKTRLTLYFDKVSGLLSRVTYAYPSILGSTAQINDYSNYKKVNGVLLPMMLVNRTSWGDTVQEFKSAKVDEKIDATVFDPPKGK